MTPTGAERSWYNQATRTKEKSMAAHPIEIEGTWEEVVKYGPELAGRRVRLIVLSEGAEEPYPDVPPEARPSTAASLLKHAGTWVGDDLEECLKDVYANRTQARF
jgi:hypothetical protein